MNYQELIERLRYERANDPEKMMRTIAAKLSDVEIKAVSEYAAGLR